MLYIDFFEKNIEIRTGGYYSGSRWPSGLALGLSALWSRVQSHWQWEPMIIIESTF